MKLTFLIYTTLFGIAFLFIIYSSIALSKVFDSKSINHSGSSKLKNNNNNNENKQIIIDENYHHQQQQINKPSSIFDQSFLNFNHNSTIELNNNNDNNQNQNIDELFTCENISMIELIDKDKPWRIGEFKTIWRATFVHYYLFSF